MVSVVRCDPWLSGSVAELLLGIRVVSDVPVGVSLLGAAAVSISPVHLSGVVHSFPSFLWGVPVLMPVLLSHSKSLSV